MMTKPQLLLAALMLCCCIASLQALPRNRCQCIRTSSAPISIRVMKKIEVIPITGYCRRAEIIVTRKNNTKICVNPNVPWVSALLRNLQSSYPGSTTDSRNAF